MKVSDIVWMFFIVCLTIAIMTRYTTEQKSKGHAISNFLSYYHNIEIDPKDARYFSINVNQYDVNIKDLEIFSSIIQEEESVYDYR